MVVPLKRLESGATSAAHADVPIRVGRAAWSKPPPANAPRPSDVVRMSVRRVKCPALGRADIGNGLRAFMCAAAAAAHRHAASLGGPALSVGRPVLSRVRIHPRCVSRIRALILPQRDRRVKMLRGEDSGSVISSPSRRSPGSTLQSVVSGLLAKLGSVRAHAGAHAARTLARAGGPSRGRPVRRLTGLRVAG